MSLLCQGGLRSVETLCEVFDGRSQVCDLILEMCPHFFQLLREGVHEFGGFQVGGQEEREVC